MNLGTSQYLAGLEEETYFWIPLSLSLSPLARRGDEIPRLSMFQQVNWQT